MAKKRLEILQRDKFQCRVCKDKENTLHVHHIFYEKEAVNVWDYPDNVLITLCEDCHSYEHDFNFYNIANDLLKKNNFIN